MALVVTVALESVNDRVTPAVFFVRIVSPIFMSVIYIKNPSSIPVPSSQVLVVEDYPRNQKSPFPSVIILENILNAPGSRIYMEIIA